MTICVAVVVEKKKAGRANKFFYILCFIVIINKTKTKTLKNLKLIFNFLKKIKS